MSKIFTKLIAAVAIAFAGVAMLATPAFAEDTNCVDGSSDTNCTAATADGSVLTDDPTDSAATTSTNTEDNNADTVEEDVVVETETDDYADPLMWPVYISIGAIIGTIILVILTNLTNRKNK